MKTFLEPWSASPAAAANGHGPDGARAGTIDRAGVERAVADLLAALGIDPDEEAVRETPRRVARMLGELLEPAPFRPTTFPNDGGYDELVLVRDIAFSSLCEHHLLPFVGVAHVGYLPGDRILGLSKLPRVVEHCARRLQVQERLTAQVADWLDREVGARGVGVVIEATHSCMTLRGVRQPSAVTRTSALRGLVRDDPRTRDEFLRAAGAGRPA
jgi:GTP cyclohydrolase IA